MIIKAAPHNSARANPEKIWVLMKAVFCRNTLCIARKSDKIRTLIFQEAPKADCAVLPKLFLRGSFFLCQHVSLSRNVDIRNQIVYKRVMVGWAYRLVLTNTRQNNTIRSPAAARRRPVVFPSQLGGLAGDLRVDLNGSFEPVMNTRTNVRRTQFRSVSAVSVRA